MSAPEAIQRRPQGLGGAIALAGLSGELLTGETVQVTALLHPLRAERLILSLPAGLSLAELAERAYCREAGRGRVPADLICLLGGEGIEPALWHRVRPHAGTEVLFRPVPRGGMRGILGLLLAVAAVAASIWLAGLPGIVGALGATGAQILGAVAGAAIGIVGNLLLNALFPVRPPKLADQSRREVYSIAGIRNEADPFGPIPVILGRHRVYPRYGARPYTEILGEDEYLRCLFVWGYGPLAIEEIKIGETPLSEFEGVEIETFYGYAGDGAPTLYPGQTFQESLSVELEPLEWYQRTTAPEVDEISIDVIAPRGVYRVVKKNGKYENRTITINVQYRVAGSGDPWNAMPNIVITSKRMDVRRRGVRQVVARGQYEVRVRRATPKGTDDGYQFVDDMTWTALRGLRNDPPLHSAVPLAVTALRIKATAQLNGTLETLNGICTSRAQAWDGSAWVDDTPTRNPADLYRLVCQGPANARPLSDARLDLPALEAWADYCAAKGWKFDMVRDRASVFETLADIAAAGRGALTIVDGRQSVIWDQPEAPVVQHFTPRNSSGFSSSRAYKYWPHALRVRFVNEAMGWQQDERIVYADGYSAANATRFESVEFPGLTASGRIWQFGRFQLAQAQLRPEVYTLEADFETLVCTRGDRVRVTHDGPLFGIRAGRVRRVESGTPQLVELDEVITQASGGTYGVRFRLADGSSVVRNVVTQPGESRWLRLAGTGALPAVGDLAMFGEAGRETVILRVRGIERLPDLRARLLLVDDAPEISQADQGPIPPYDSQITIPPDPLTLRPRDLIVREEVRLGEDGLPSAAAALSWRVPRFGTIRAFEVRMSDAGPAGPWSPGGTVAPPLTALTLGDLQPGAWWFEVRCLFADGSASAWTPSGQVSLMALETPPADVTGFRISVLGDVATLTWEQVGGIAFSHYALRYSPALSGVSWATAALLADNVSGTLLQVLPRAGTYLIKAVDIGGRESINAAMIVTSLAAATLLNAVETIREDPDWSGDKEQVIYDPEYGGLRLADAGSAASVGSDGEPVRLFPEGYYYFSQGLDLSEVYTSRLTLDMEAQGLVLGVDFFDVDDVFDRADWFGGEDSSWRVVLEQRVSNNALSDPEAIWSEWSEFTASDVTARSYQWRLWLGRGTGDVTPLVRALAVTVDMPDRIIAGNDLAVPPEGLRIDFDPPYRAFKGVGIATQELETGDYHRVTEKDEAGFFVRFYDDTDTPVARSLDYVAVGYGRRLPAPPQNLIPPGLAGEFVVGGTVTLVPGVWSGEDA